jgi:hypothetical protein
MNTPPAMLQSERSRVEHVYAYIVDYKQAHDGNSPSYRMIMRACAVSSTSQVGAMIDYLRQMNRIRIVGDQRSIAVVGGEWMPPGANEYAGCMVAGAEETTT